MLCRWKDSREEDLVFVNFQTRQLRRTRESDLATKERRRREITSGEFSIFCLEDASSCYGRRLALRNK